MINEVGIEETQYIVCHNGEDVYHLCELREGQVLTSGQPYEEIFDTLEEAIAFIPESYRPKE